MDEDVVLLLDDNVRLTCERTLLSESSPYFNAMFSERFAESEKQEIRLHGINKDAMSTLILYAKSRDSRDWNDHHLGLNSENVINILQASGMLHFESIRQTCCEYLTKEILRLPNALQVLGRLTKLRNFIYVLMTYSIFFGRTWGLSVMLRLT